MDNTLKRLLEAEKKGQARLQQAYAERDRLIEAAWEEAGEAERRLDRRLPELRQSYRDKADEQAEQEIAELKREYARRMERLEALAGNRCDTAVGRAVDWILDTDNA